MSEFGNLLGFEDHQGDVMSAVAQMNYEEDLIQECRKWVDGDLKQQPSTEHIRVLLSWIDRANPTFNNNGKDF